MNKAVFFRKEQNLDERLSSYVIEQVIELPRKEYEAFASDLLADYDFLGENSELMYVDEYRVWHCLLVKSEGARDGILVNASGHRYARYVAYCSNCSDSERGR